jgi:hypothetical protein
VECPNFAGFDAAFRACGIRSGDHHPADHSLGAGLEDIAGEGMAACLADFHYAQRHAYF